VAVRHRQRPLADISPPLNRAYAGITVDPGNQQRMIVSTISHYQMRGGIGDQFYETLDGGKRWNSIVANGVQIDSNGVSWIAAASSTGPPALSSIPSTPAA
jgi:photosystem II stability/assembly factor-like uncharacterized protein